MVEVGVARRRGKGEVRAAGEECREGEPQFQAGQGGADAEVAPGAEGDVGAYWGLWDKDGNPKYW